MTRTIEQLAARARDGDRAAFDALLRETLPRVRGFLFRLGATDAELDDLAQEVFVIVIESLDRFRGASRFTSWQLGIAVNVFRAARRGRAARERATAEQVDARDAAAGSDPSAPLERGEEAARLRAALDELPAAQREAFVLRHVEELSVAEAAAVLGVPEGTVRRRAFDARERLRVAMGARGEVPAREPA